MEEYTGGNSPPRVLIGIKYFTDVENLPTYYLASSKHWN